MLHDDPLIDPEKKPILAAMQKLGYQVNPEGICYGAVWATANALWTKQFDYYVKRLEFIKSTSLKKIDKKIHKAKKRARKFSTHLLEVFRKKENVDQLLFEKEYSKEFLDGLNEKDREKLRESIQNQINRYHDFIEQEWKNNFTQDDNFLLDIDPLFNSLMMYFESHEYKFLYENGMDPLFQSGLNATSFVSPVALDKNTVVHIDTFTGSYNDINIKKYFQSLQNTLDKHKLSENPMLVLSSSDHSILVHYDPSYGWVVANEFNFPLLYTKDAAEIAEEVLYIFSNNRWAVFSTEIYATNAFSDEIKKAIQDWKSTKEYLATRKFTKQNILKKDSYGYDWISIAIEKNDIEAVKSILDTNLIDINALSGKGIPLILIAILHQQEKLVELLLENQPVLNFLDKEGNDIIHTAIMARNFNIFKLLVDNGRNIYYEHNSVPYIHLAAEHGAVEIMKFLVNENIKYDELYKNLTPLAVAVKYGHLPVVKFLIEKGALIDKAEDNKTPLFLSVAHKRVDIMIYLLDHGADRNKVVNIKIKQIIEKAEEFGNKNIKDTLINLNISENSKIQNISLLHFAIYYGHYSIVKSLLNYDMNLDVKAKEHTTKHEVSVFDFAKLLNRLEILKLLYSKKLETMKAEFVVPFRGESIDKLIKDLDKLKTIDEVDRMVNEFLKLDALAIQLSILCQTYFSAKTFDYINLANEVYAGKSEKTKATLVIQLEEALNGIKQSQQGFQSQHFLPQRESTQKDIGEEPVIKKKKYE